MTEKKSKTYNASTPCMKPLPPPLGTMVPPHPGGGGALSTKMRFPPTPWGGGGQTPRNSSLNSIAFSKSTLQRIYSKQRTHKIGKN